MADFDDLLVAIVGHAQGEDGVALGQDGRVDLGRSLRDDAQRGAVLATFLGDLGDRSLAGLEAEVGVGRDIAVRFLAHQRHRHLTFAPEREIEGQAAEHRYRRR